MQSNDLCLVFAPAITIIVGILKRVPFLSKSPKTVAFVVAIVLNVGSTVVFHGVAASAAEIVRCVLMSFAGGIALHETVVDPQNGVRGLFV